MLSKTKNAPHKRRDTIKTCSSRNNPIIAFLTKETTDGDPYWVVGVIAFLFATMFLQGANIVAPLMWLGVL